MNNRPDCQARPGEVHQPNCDVERCSVCAGQYFSCGCEQHNPEESRWTGEWPGVLECREFGWYAKLIPGKGWVECDRDDPDASEDLNRWVVHVMRKKQKENRDKKLAKKT